MNYKLAILFILMSLFFTGCSNKQVSNEIAMTSEPTLPQKPIVTDCGKDETANEDDYFKVVKESESDYKVYLYGIDKKVYKELDFPKQPYVEKVEEYLIKVVISTGSPSNYTTFYNIKDKKESTTAIFNLLLYDKGKVVYVEDGKLIISDVFDKNLYYKEIKRNFSTDYSNPASFEVKFIENNKLELKYLEGKDFEEKTEIINLYSSTNSEDYVGHWYTSVPYTGGNSTTIDIKEMSNSSVSFHLYICRTYYYDATNIKLENNIAKFVDNGDYKTNGTIEFVNKSIIVNIEKTELPILETGKTVFNYKVSEFKPVSTTPYNGATDVVLDKGIEIDFGRKIYNTANGICASLTKPNEPIGSSDSYMILDGEIKDNKLVFTPSSELMNTSKLKIEAGKKYVFGISEGELRDEAGNINGEINLEYTMKN